MKFSYIILCLGLYLLQAEAIRRKPKSSKTEHSNDDDDYEGSDTATTTRRKSGGRTSDVSNYLQDPLQSTQLVTKKTKIAGTKVTADEILRNHHLYFKGTTRRQFKGEVLAYVTPWNKKGYMMAKIMAPKLTWLVPVWFQIRNEGGNGLGITGIHDMDTKWLSDVKHAATAGSSSGNDDTDSSEKKQMCVDDEGDEYECSDSSSSSSTSGASTAGDDDQESSLKILPRVAIEASIADEAAVVEIAEKLNELRLSHGFHGFTIESSLHEFPQTVLLLKELKSKGCVLIMVLPPMQRVNDNIRSAMTILSEHVDRFSIMTYDSPGKENGQPNAPIYWVTDVMEALGSVQAMRGKLLMGLPMYGWRGNDAMIADTMLVWMATAPGGVEIEWDSQAQEHIFINEEKGVRSSYPTVAFLLKRLQLAQSMEAVAGVALWELGQMMGMFIDLF